MLVGAEMIWDLSQVRHVRWRLQWPEAVLSAVNGSPERDLSNMAASGCLNSDLATGLPPTKDCTQPWNSHFSHPALELTCSPSALLSWLVMGRTRRQACLLIQELSRNWGHILKHSQWIQEKNCSFHHELTQERTRVPMCVT